ncbi:MAG: hypothetical protein NT028_08860 [candidate division Zixibacteria bacterium]|nr:hypothetical protein [candidate division Zixibacteria bacterium]
MTKTLTITAVVLVVFLGICYWVISDKQKTSVQGVGESLTVVQHYLGMGNLKASSGLMEQVRYDIESKTNAINKFYTLPSIRRSWKDQLLRYDSLGKHLKKRTDAAVEALSYVADLARQGHYQMAEEKLRDGTIESASEDRLSQVLARYVQRLKFQDFRAADDAASQLDSLLPEELWANDSTNAFWTLVNEQREANRTKQGRIATEVKQLAAMAVARESYDFKPSLRGRTMIWDFTKNNVDLAYELLGDDLRASLWDQQITMFCIIQRRSIEIGRYSISNEPGYKEKMTIGVVYWPQRKSPGVAEVWGGEPVYSRPVRYTPEYGSAVNIKNWIEGLPRK